MSHETVDLVEGWTSRLDFQLLSDGVKHSLSTGDVHAAYLFDKNGDPVTTSTSQITIVAAACGSIGFTASSCYWHAGLAPYTLRFAEKDSNGLWAFFPNADPITIGVRSA